MITIYNIYATKEDKRNMFFCCWWELYKQMIHTKRYKKNWKLYSLNSNKFIIYQKFWEKSSKILKFKENHNSGKFYWQKQNLKKKLFEKKWAELEFHLHENCGHKIVQNVLFTPYLHGTKMNAMQPKCRKFIPPTTYRHATAAFSLAIVRVSRFRAEIMCLFEN